MWTLNMKSSLRFPFLWSKNLTFILLLFVFFFLRKKNLKEPKIHFFFETCSFYLEPSFDIDWIHFQVWSHALFLLFRINQNKWKYWKKIVEISVEKMKKFDDEERKKWIKLFKLTNKYLSKRFYTHFSH